MQAKVYKAPWPFKECTYIYTGQSSYSIGTSALPDMSALKAVLQLLHIDASHEVITASFNLIMVHLKEYYWFFAVLIIQG